MTSALEKLRAMARNTSAPDEINEKNEITPPKPGSEGLLSFNSFLSSHSSAIDITPNDLLPAADADDLDERAALVEYGARVPRTWAEGFAVLSTMPAPSGFSPARWQRIIDAAGAFLDVWADKAIAAGWTDLDVFGCNSAAPDRRFDAMGLILLLDRCEVVAIDADGADLVLTKTGAMQRYRRRPLPVGTVSLWNLVHAR